MSARFFTGSSYGHFLHVYPTIIRYRFVIDLFISYQGLNLNQVVLPKSCTWAHINDLIGVVV